MNRVDIEIALEKAESHCLESLTLVMPIPKSGIRGYKLKTPFGLAEIACVNYRDKMVVFWIEIKKVRAWLDKNFAY